MKKLLQQVLFIPVVFQALIACSPATSQTCATETKEIEARVNFHSVMFFYHSWYSVEIKRKTNQTWTKLLDKYQVDSGKNVCDSFRVHFNAKRQMYTLDFMNFIFSSLDFGKTWKLKP
jgi:hypothetical protein